MRHEGERLPNDLLRRAREARVSPSGSGRPMSRQELADAASVHLRHPLSADYIARLERGEIRWPSKVIRDALRRVLGASDDSELGFYITRRTTTLPPVSLNLADGERPDASVVSLADSCALGLEDVVTILQRVHRRQRTLNPRIVTQLSDAITELIEGYDQMDHAILIPALVRQRTWVDTLLDDCPDLQQRRDLLRVACGTAGLLGYVAVGRGSFPVARAYLTEAIGLADLAGDRDLRAWVRGTQSLAEYYAGNFRDALAYAEDGLASTGSGGPQAARLLVNGIARAAGKLDDEGRARKAIDAAVGLSQTKAAGLASSVTLGPYTAAQIATNAATAFLSLGMSEEVEAHVQRALPDVERSGSPWVRSLVLIDLATALVTSRSADGDRACGLLLQALDVSAGRPIVSVTIRAKEFVQAATERWGGAWSGQMGDVRDAVAALEYSRG